MHPHCTSWPPRLVARSSPAALVSVVMACALTVLAPRARAEDTVDPTFGVNGIVRTTFGSNNSDEPRDLLIQPDGRILTAGKSSNNDDGTSYVAISRHTADGLPDTAGFGVDGKVLARFVFRDHANAIALQGDGKIVAAGMRMTSTGVSTQKWTLYRFRADGAVDTTFGDGGTVASDWLPSTEYAAVHVRPDGNILAGGRCNPNFYGGVHAFIAGRFLSDGTLAMGSTFEYFKPTHRGSGAFQNDGKVLYANVGPRQDGWPSEFHMTRVDSAGIPDAGFGTGGIVRTGVVAAMFTDHRVQVLEGGKILLVGTTPRDGGGSNWTALRFLPDGSPDSLFGTNGRTDISFIAGMADYCYDAAIDADGKILLAGRAGVSIYGDGVGLARLLPDGSPDSTFSGDGKFATTLSGAAGTHYFTRVLVLPDGKILTAGYDYGSNGGDFFLARFFPYDPADVDAVEAEGSSLEVTASPNPSRGATSIRFRLPFEQGVRVGIFDPTGRMVRRLFDGTLSGGTHAIDWDGQDEFGHELAAGVYFTRLSTRGEEHAVRLIRVR